MLEKNPDCFRNRYAKLCAPSIINRTIEEITPHGNNDIALIRLNELVPLHNEEPEKSIVAPVCLPWSDEAKEIVSDLKFVTVTGWGKVTNLNINYSSSDRTLRKKKLKKFSRSDCESDFQNENQICAGVARGE